jgi:hypothetical protein
MLARPGDGAPHYDCWCSIPYRIPYRAHPAGVNPNTPIATTTGVSATARIYTPNLVNGRLEVIITNQGFVIYRNP